jgi:hypothetical protein
MNKTVIGFIADVLYLKGLINYDEFEAIMDVHSEVDLGIVVERMFGGDFNAYKKGETYGVIIK